MTVAIALGISLSGYGEETPGSDSAFGFADIGLGLLEPSARAAMPHSPNDAAESTSVGESAPADLLRVARETYCREIRDAREIQMSMLPADDPGLPWLDFCSVSLPASERARQ